MTSTKDRTARWNRYWDKKSRNYDKEMTFFDRHLFGDSRTWACGQATGEVLEVAVGTGLNLEAYPPDITLTGIDLSGAMLDLARHRTTELGRTATLQRADAHKLPFEDASFDTVVCTFGLCAIPDHTKAIAEMTRVLRSGGRLILVDHIASTSRVARGSSGSCRFSPCRWVGSTFCAGHSTRYAPPDSTSSKSSGSNSASSNASSPANPPRSDRRYSRVIAGSGCSAGRR